ncbi:NAD-dependent epimerase/dehydratase family protein [Amycolatopsis sp. NPDC059027]|uniref:NAD-dependent epimerase/dehydratase family protein n=1 Tax=Amycolatopsis sp. NPDC059027 TaxID=3346709 RepID=UPI003671ABE0
MTAGRAVVLGGTGWIGRHVCDVFARRGYEVLTVARNPASHVAAHRFHRLDVAAAPAGVLTELLRRARADVVINATDAANATDGWAHPEEALRRFNVGVVDRLVTAMARLPWRPRLVHLGTIFEYGPVPDGALMHEALEPAPVGAYARTKLAGSAAVLDATREDVIDGVVLRIVNVCGPHPSPAAFPGKLLALVRAAAATGGDVELAIADSRRDFVDVRDVAMACLLAAESAVTGRVVNIGSGVAVELREFVELFVTTAGLPPDVLKGRTGPVPSLGTGWSRADIRLAAELLSWRPTVGLPESVRDTWEAASG